jgi:transcriptional regulator with XRE-family HTH domain
MNEAEPPDMTDQRFAQNLRAAREYAGMSQAALAAEMAAAGYPFHQQTIARIEGGAQRVRLAEALALALAVHSSLDALARPTGVALAGHRIRVAAGQVRSARTGLWAASGHFDERKRNLEGLLAAAVEDGHGEALADEIRIGEQSLRGDEPGYGGGPEGDRM